MDLNKNMKSIQPIDPVFQPIRIKGNTVQSHQTLFVRYCLKIIPHAVKFPAIRTNSRIVSKAVTAQPAMKNTVLAVP